MLEHLQASVWYLVENDPSVPLLQEHVAVPHWSSDRVMVHKGIDESHHFSFATSGRFPFSDCLPVRLDLFSLLTPCHILKIHVYLMHM